MVLPEPGFFALMGIFVQLAYLRIYTLTNTYGLKCALIHREKICRELAKGFDFVLAFELLWRSPRSLFSDGLPATRYRNECPER